MDSIEGRAVEQRVMKCKCQEKVFKSELSFWSTAVTVINTINQSLAIVVASSLEYCNRQRSGDKAMAKEKNLGHDFLLSWAFVITGVN